jgi:hypothetical protein
MNLATSRLSAKAASKWSLGRQSNVLIVELIIPETVTERQSRKEAAPAIIQSYEHDSSDRPDKTPYPEAIDCVSCGETVSKYALTCPHCGCNYANREWVISIRAAVIGVLIVLAIVGLYVLVTR